MYTEIVTTITQKITTANGELEPLGIDVHIDPGDLIVALTEDQIKQVVVVGLRRALKEIEPEDGH